MGVVAGSEVAVMAPRKRVDGWNAAAVVRETRQERIAREKAERETADRKGRLEANQRHVAVTGAVMPQGGAHRRKGKA